MCISIKMFAFGKLCDIMLPSCGSKRISNERRKSMSHLERQFEKFRQNTIGYNQSFKTCYGEKNMIYADWTASGRLYRSIEEHIADVFGPFVGNTHSESNLTGSTMTKAYNIAKEMIKKHVNADKNDVIITCGSGMTSVVNKLQRILGLRVPEKLKNYLDIPDELRPVIFITHMEHHFNHTSWLETISIVKVIPPNSEGTPDLNELEKLLKEHGDKKIKIGAFTACSNVTGVQTPYHNLAKLMHEHNGICLVDFAASAPYVDINMHPDDPMEKLDGIYFSPHKFLGGPGTSGVVVFDSRLYSNKIPDQPGGGTVDWTNPWGGYKYSADIEAREDGGTPGFLQTIKTAMCIDLKNQMKVENMLNREKELTSILFKELNEIDGLHILANNARNRLGIISFYIEGLHYNLVVKILNDRFGIQTRGGCSCAGTYGHFLLGIDNERSKIITDQIDSGNVSVKPGWVRLSIHPMMKTDEVKYITDSIKDILKNIKEWEQDYIYDNRVNEFRNIQSTQLDEFDIIKWFKV